LYIAVVRRDPDKPVSKGMLVQSKREDRLERGPEGHKDLRAQAGKMRRRTKESYVGVYQEDGVIAVPANRATYPRLPKDFTSEGVSLGQLVADGLRCRRGDPERGPDPSLDPIEGMKQKMHE